MLATSQSIRCFPMGKLPQGGAPACEPEGGVLYSNVTMVYGRHIVISYGKSPCLNKFNRSINHLLGIIVTSTINKQTILTIGKSPCLNLGFVDTIHDTPNKSPNYLPRGP